MEEFKPQTLSDLVGNKLQIERLVTAIRFNTPALVLGPPGVGKTTSVYAIANELGYKVIEFNASMDRTADFFKNVLMQVRTKHFEFVIYLFDEIDGMVKQNFKYLKELCEHTKFPIVMIANDKYKLPKWFLVWCERHCEIVKFNKPFARDIVALIKRLEKKTGLKVKHFDSISGDIRNSILTAFYGAETYDQNTVFDIVKKVFMGASDVDYSVFKRDKLLYIWLIDNAPNFYRNLRQLFKAIQIIVLAEKTNKPEMLSLLPKSLGGEVEYPYYLKRIVEIRRQGK